VKRSGVPVHPGGPRIEAVDAAMGLRREQTAVSQEVLASYGNMSSATVLFIIEALLERKAEPPCVVLGFGPGLVAEAALFV
jgi:predicted naringenin-chalcone synthase